MKNLMCLLILSIYFLPAFSHPSQNDCSTSLLAESESNAAEEKAKAYIEVIHTALKEAIISLEVLELILASEVPFNPLETSKEVALTPYSRAIDEILDQQGEISWPLIKKQVTDLLRAERETTNVSVNRDKLATQEVLLELSTAPRKITLDGKIDKQRYRERKWYRTLLEVFEDFGNPRVLAVGPGGDVDIIDPLSGEVLTRHTFEGFDLIDTIVTFQTPIGPFAILGVSEGDHGPTYHVMNLETGKYKIIASSKHRKGTQHPVIVHSDEGGIYLVLTDDGYFSVYPIPLDLELDSSQKPTHTPRALVSSSTAYFGNLDAVLTENGWRVVHGDLSGSILLFDPFKSLVDIPPHLTSIPMFQHPIALVIEEPMSSSSRTGGSIAVPPGYRPVIFSHADNDKPARIVHTRNPGILDVVDLNGEQIYSYGTTSSSLCALSKHTWSDGERGVFVTDYRMVTWYDIDSTEERSMSYHLRGAAQSIPLPFEVGKNKYFAQLSFTENSEGPRYSGAILAIYELDTGSRIDQIRIPLQPKWLLNRNEGSFVRERMDLSLKKVTTQEGTFLIASLSEYDVWIFKIATR